MGKVCIIKGEINEERAAEFLDVLGQTAGKEEVTIFLNTAGGSAQQAMEIVDLIRAHGAVTIVAFGECCSAGALILCAANRSLATPSCELLVHYGCEVNESQEDAKKHRKITRWMKELIKSKVKVSPRTVSNWFNKDKEFTALEAFEVGLIDGILANPLDVFKEGACS